MVTIYSKPGCTKCEEAKKKIKALGIEFRVRDAQAVINGEEIVHDKNERNDFTAAYMDYMELPLISDGEKCSRAEDFLKGKEDEKAT